MGKKNIDIDQQEKEILKDFEADEFTSVNKPQEEMRLAKAAAANFVKRNSRINIRISNADLNMIRKIAIQEGLPYQTLVASILHKFVAGRLVDRKY